MGRGILVKSKLKMNKHFVCGLMIVISFSSGFARQADTIRISEKDINTSVLKEGTHRYLVYFKQGKDAPRRDVQFWTRSIERKQWNGKPALAITQVWEYKDTINHTVYSVCDASTMRPLFHEFWWKQRDSVQVDFTKASILINKQPLTAAESLKQRATIWQAFDSVKNSFVLNWHLDLEVFPTLPFREGVTFLIPFYDPGLAFPAKQVAYRVTGSAQLTGYDNQPIDCWLLQHEDAGNREIFWISKKTREVLKLEQDINGRMFRYKIKLGYSN